jgi:hypothetical protein
MSSPSLSFLLLLEATHYINAPAGGFIARPTTFFEKILQTCYNDHAIKTAASALSL